MTLNIVFMGTPDFAVPSIAEIVSSPHLWGEVAGAKRRSMGGYLRFNLRFPKITPHPHFVGLPPINGEKDITL